MRTAQVIEVNEIIVHMLNPRDGRVLYSERAIPLGSNLPLREYFTDHIRQSLRDSVAKAARFETIDDTVPSGWCAALLAGHLDLVTGSRRLAERLCDIINRDRRVAPGDLAVCVYRAGTSSNLDKYVGLLKIDPSEVFRHRDATDEFGRRYVDLDILLDAFPTNRERLQKCAFVQGLDPRDEYDMLLLDRQTGPTKAGTVATFFIRDFLGASFALDPQVRTERFYKSMLTVQNQLRRELHPDESLAVEQATDSAMKSTQVNVNSLIDGLPIAEHHRQRFRDELAQRLPDQEFEIDPHVAEKFVQKKRYRGSQGLKVEINTDASGQIIHSVRHNPQASPPYWEVVLHTEKWDEVPG